MAAAASTDLGFSMGGDISALIASFNQAKAQGDQVAANMEQYARRISDAFENQAGKGIAVYVDHAKEAAKALDDWAGQAAANADSIAEGNKQAAESFAAVAAEAQSLKERAGQALSELTESSKAAGVAASVAIGALLAGTVAGAIYTAYKVATTVADEVIGLFTGDTYKKESVQALVAYTDQITALQGQLGGTAGNAQAVQTALEKLGVTAASYTASLAAARAGLSSNAQEFERLGVVIKAANGSQLSTQQILKNSLTTVNQYTEGLDRNAAAVSLGFESYAALASAVAVGNGAVDTARERLQAYNLVISERTQSAVNDYKQAMRSFQQETDLTKRGFEQAIADNIMPLLTDLADFFQEGFPFAVNAFRFSIATLNALFYGLKSVVYTVTEAILTAIESLTSGVGGLAEGAYKALHGDFKGAEDAVKAGYDGIKKRFEEGGKNIETQLRKNRDAMLLGIGEQGRAALRNALGDNAVLFGLGPENQPAKAGKTFNPKPGAGPDTWREELTKALTELEAQAKAEEQLLASRNKALDAYYQQNYLSVQRYSDARQQVLQEDFDKTKSIYDKEAAVIAKAIASTGDSKQQLYGAKQLVEVQERRNKLDSEFGQKTTDYFFQAAAATRQYSDSVAALNDQLARLQGRSGDTAGDAFDRANRPLRDRATFSADSETVAKLDQLRSAAVAQAQLNDFQQQAARLQQQQANVESAVSIAQNQGAITELNALKQISDSRAASLVQLSDIYTKMQEIAAASGNPKMIQDAANFKAALDQQAASADQVALKFKKIGETGLERFFEDTLMRTKTLKEAFADMAQYFILQVARMQATNLAKSIVNGNGSSSGGGGILSGIGSWVSGLFGFADGGDPPVGVPSIVGERGPELFVPKSSGTIIPNGSMGGGNVTYAPQLVFQTYGDPDRAMMARVAAQAMEAAKADILNQMGRGGAWSRAIGKS